MDEAANTAMAKRGRGALTNRDGRFERHGHALEDDGWGSLAEAAAEAQVRTLVQEDTTRSIIATNDSPDVPFERSINPYRGCEHGCIYCFARPSHAYLGMSPGLDFETRLFAKPNAAALLERAFRRPGYTVKPIALGASTDPYQPLERERGITRSVLEVMERFGHPVGVVTKSALVTRDIDILARMAKQRLATVAISLTTLDRRLARAMEPRAATPSRRLAAMAELTAAGVPVTVLTSPMIPGLNDHELERIVEASADHGASGANAILLRLPLEIADLFTEWLHAHVPDRAAKVLSLIRQTRGGKLYDSRFGTRMRGQGPYADLLVQRLRRAKARYGLSDRDWRLACDQFAVPPTPGDQLALFG